MNKLSKTLVVIVISLLIAISVLFFLSKNQQRVYSEKLNKQDLQIQSLKQELVYRAHERKAILKKHAYDLAVYKTKSEQIPKTIEKHVKIKDSLIALPADEQFDFFAKRITQARDNGRW